MYLLSFGLIHQHACGFEQTGFLDIWEEATLSIKRKGYSIKCNNNDIIAAEKFSSSNAVRFMPSLFLSFLLIK